MARLDSAIGSARTRRNWLGAAQIWRVCVSVVFNLWHAWMRMGDLGRIFRRRVWITTVSDQADSCDSEFVLMSSTLWNDQNLFLTTLKIRIYPKTLLFSDERGSDSNCWWEKPLVVALKHSEGIKHEVLLQNPKLTITTIHALSLSLSLSSVPLNSIHSH